MQRVPTHSAQPFPATSDSTVSDAAEAMERLHSRQLIVQRGGVPVGFLTEEDIVGKVLAPGLDPSVTHLQDVMAAARDDGSESLLIDDEPFPRAPLWGAESLLQRDDDEMRVVLEVLSGRCEECGVYNEELVDHEGLRMCGDCSGLRTMLFR